jgi:uncharacterized protein YqfA (UPF0365 family)
MPTAVFVLLAITGLMITVVFAVITLFFFRPWVRALLGGAPISAVTIIGMKLRGNPVNLLIDTALALNHRGIPVGIRDVETAYIAYKGRAFTPTQLADIVIERGAKADRPA